MKKLIPWLTLIIELTVLIGGGYKLVALQTDTAVQAERSWTAIKNIYQMSAGGLPPDRAAELINSTEPLLKSALGTKITHCYAPGKYGFVPTTWTIEALDAVPNIQAVYGNINEPCEKTNIEVKLGSIGALKRIEEKTASLEMWFWGLALALMMLKVSEMLIRLRPEVPRTDARRKKKRKR